MKTKKRSSSSSGKRFARSVSAKKSSTKRGSRKSTSRRSAPRSRKEGFVAKLEELTPL